MTPKRRFYYVGGSKGGVGKSLFSFALADLLLEGQEPLLLVDTDTDNPDVFKAHQNCESDNFAIRLIALDDADGWSDLMDMAEKLRDHNVVVNGAARAKASVASFGEIMTGALAELGDDPEVFWLINRQRDSLELLRAFQDALPQVRINVCRNLYFGDSARFDLYNDSKTRALVEATGRTLDFPAVGNRVADWLQSRRSSIAVALQEMPLGMRAELKRWRNLFREKFSCVLEERQ